VSELFDLLDRDWYCDILEQSRALRRELTPYPYQPPDEPEHLHVDTLNLGVSTEIADDIDDSLPTTSEILSREEERYSHGEFLARVSGRVERRFHVRKVEFGDPDKGVRVIISDQELRKMLRDLESRVIGVDSSVLRVRYVQGSLIVMGVGVAVHGYENYELHGYTLAQLFVFNSGVADRCLRITETEPSKVGREISGLMYKFEMQALAKHSSPGTYAFKCGSIRPSVSSPHELKRVIKRDIIPVGVVKNPYSRLITNFYSSVFGNDYYSDAAAFQEILEPGERSRWFMISRPGSIGQFLVAYYKPPLDVMGYEPPMCRLEIPLEFFRYANRAVKVYTMGVLIASDVFSPTCAWINVSEFIARNILPPRDVVTSLIGDSISSPLTPSFDHLRGMDNSHVIEELDGRWRS